MNPELHDHEDSPFMYCSVEGCDWVRDVPAPVPSQADKIDAIYAFVQRVTPIIDAVEQNLPKVLAQVENLGPMLDSITSHPMLKMLGFGR